MMRNENAASSIRDPSEGFCLWVSLIFRSNSRISSRKPSGLRSFNFKCSIRRLAESNADFPAESRRAGLTGTVLSVMNQIDFPRRDKCGLSALFPDQISFQRDFNRKAGIIPVAEPLPSFQVHMIHEAWPQRQRQPLFKPVCPYHDIVKPTGNLHLFGKQTRIVCIEH